MDIPDEAKEPVSQLNVGTTLREAREGQGMSVYDIAERIKFAPKQVEALEANDYERLPKATFLRGFVRSYARVLQLDEAELIAALPTEPSTQQITKQQIVDVSFPSVLASRRINVMWLAGALGVALVLGLFVWLSDGESAQKPSEVVVETVPLPMQDAGASAVVAPPTLSAEPEIAKIAEPRKVEQKVTKTQTTAVTAPVPVIPVVSSVASTATAKPPVAPEMLKRRPLHFVFTGAAWIEVIDVNGDILLSRSNLGGTEKWIGGPRRAPYDVSIGNPGNVKMYYKGKEIDLSEYAGMNTARLKVE
ncbi:MAG: hypothetical protein A2100_04510 [Sideroxydans sp. GWF2_59_14]|nr:MAG: hypothetical protein A2100_04510 [Sideroxydans sp. GWF2_59_14]